MDSKGENVFMKSYEVEIIYGFEKILNSSRV